MSPLIPILLYHSVSATASPRFRPYAVAPDLFAEHMQILSRSGFDTLTVSELVETLVGSRKTSNRRVAVVTFDDGFSDFAEAAWPVLDSFRIAATLYIATDYLGATSRWLEDLGDGERPMLTQNQVRALADSGVEIGAHGQSHRELDVLSEAEARAEIAGSKQSLESVVERRVDTFAYPHGYHGNNVRRLVIDAGFTSACAVKEGASSPEDDPFALARITIRGETSPDAFRLLLGQEGLNVAPRRQEAIRANLWRQVRRAGHLTGVRRMR